MSGANTSALLADSEHVAALQDGNVEFDLGSEEDYGSEEYLDDGGDDPEPQPQPQRAPDPPPKAADADDAMRLFQESQREHMDMLGRVMEYGENPLTQHCVPGDLSVDTPLPRLKRIEESCVLQLRARKKAASRRTGVGLLNKLTCWLASGVEMGNDRFLDPETQFALHGLGESVAASVETGDFEGVHGDIWEKYGQTILGRAATDPLLQWAIIMAGAISDHAQGRKEAYKAGRLIDPRKEAIRRRDLEAPSDGYTSASDSEGEEPPPPSRRSPRPGLMDQALRRRRARPKGKSPEPSPSPPPPWRPPATEESRELDALFDAFEAEPPPRPADGDDEGGDLGDIDL